VFQAPEGDGKGTPSDLEFAGVRVIPCAADCSLPLWMADIVCATTINGEDLARDES
jgi:hypothetical protein